MIVWFVLKLFILIVIHYLSIRILITYMKRIILIMTENNENFTC